MITVLQTLPSLEFGGVERGTIEVADELVRQGHRSLVISARGRLVKQLTENGSEHIEMPIGKKSLLTFRYVRVLRKLIKDNNIDIVHARSRLPAWICYLACRGIAREHRPGFVTTVHGHYSVNPYSKIMTYGDRVIAISEFINQYILKNYSNIAPEKISVIPRGVDSNNYPYGFKPPDTWVRSWNEQYPQFRNKYLVTLPGRISRRKGHDDFLNILLALKNSGANTHGLIVGGAQPGKVNYENDIKAKASLLNINNSVTFLGHRDDLREILSVSNVVLSLSQEPEAFGRTVLEPVSMGVPVIAYDHGGASEILKKIFPEGLITNGDINAAAERVLSLMKSSPSVPDTNPYTLQRMLDNTLSLYGAIASVRKANSSGFRKH